MTDYQPTLAMDIKEGDEVQYHGEVNWYVSKRKWTTINFSVGGHGETVKVLNDEILQVKRPEPVTPALRTDDVRTYPSNLWAVVDLDTGAVLGTNVVLVPLLPEETDGMSDQEIVAYAQLHSVPLLVGEVN